MSCRFLQAAVPIVSPKAQVPGRLHWWQRSLDLDSTVRMKVLTLQRSPELPSSQVGTLFQREISVCKNHHNNGVSGADIFHKPHADGQPTLLWRVTLGKSLNSFGFGLSATAPAPSDLDVRGSCELLMN